MEGWWNWTATALQYDEYHSDPLRPGSVPGASSSRSASSYRAQPRGGPPRKASGSRFTLQLRALITGLAGFSLQSLTRNALLSQNQPLNGLLRNLVTRAGFQRPTTP